MTDIHDPKDLVVPPADQKQAVETADVTAPIIVSLGKKKRKAIKQLKRGKGSAMTEVLDVIDQVRATLGTQADGKILVPVVVLYERKQRRFRGLF
jgi:hypothetical protein